MEKATRTKILKGMLKLATGLVVAWAVIYHDVFALVLDYPGDMGDALDGGLILTTDNLHAKRPVNSPGNSYALQTNAFSSLQKSKTPPELLHIEDHLRTILDSYWNGENADLRAVLTDHQWLISILPTANQIVACPEFMPQRVVHAKRGILPHGFMLEEKLFALQAAQACEEGDLARMKVNIQAIRQLGLHARAGFGCTGTFHQTIADDIGLNTIAQLRLRHSDNPNVDSTLDELWAGWEDAPEPGYSSSTPNTKQIREALEFTIVAEFNEEAVRHRFQIPGLAIAQRDWRLKNIRQFLESMYGGSAGDYWPTWVYTLGSASFHADLSGKWSYASGENLREWANAWVTSNVSRSLHRASFEVVQEYLRTKSIPKQLLSTKVDVCNQLPISYVLDGRKATFTSTMPQWAFAFPGPPKVVVVFPEAKK